MTLAKEIREAAEADFLYFVKKYCFNCEQDLPLTSFSNNKTKKDGKATQCKECLNAYVRNRRASDEEFRLKLNKYQSNWSSKDPNRRVRKKKWVSLNRDKLACKTARRRARTKAAMPNWLTESDLNQIKNLYWLAKDLKSVTGEEYHVDHIIPLQGKNVCGLHVPWNLQVLPSDVNLKKSNG